MKKIIYLLIVGYGVIFLILYNGYGSMVVLVMAALLPFCLKSITFLLRRKTRVVVRTAYPTVEQGSGVELRLRICNDSAMLPISKGFVFLEYANALSGERNKKKIPFQVKAEGEELLTVTWKAEHCGRMAVRIKGVRVYDYLGVFYAKVRISGKRKKAKEWMGEILVMPEYLDLLVDPAVGWMGTDGDGNLYSKHKRGEDPSEIFAIREYKDGDKLHRIHWNLSYKKNQYMVKEYSLPLVCAVTVMLDFAMPKKEGRRLAYMDAILKLAFSLSYSFVEADLLHYVVWYDGGAREPVRRMITLEEEVHEAFGEVLTASRVKGKSGRKSQAALLEGGEALRKEYAERYGKEKQNIIYYISTRKPVAEGWERRDLLEQLGCRKMEWVQIVADVKTDDEGLERFDDVRVREFGLGRLDEDVKEWMEGA